MKKDEIFEGLKKVLELTERLDKTTEVLTEIENLLSRQYNLVDENINVVEFVIEIDYRGVLRVPMFFDAFSMPSIYNLDEVEEVQVEKVELSGGGKVIILSIEGRIEEKLGIRFFGASISLNSIRLDELIMLTYNPQLIDAIIKKLDETYRNTSEKLKKLIEKLKQIVILLDMILLK